MNNKTKKEKPVDIEIQQYTNVTDTIKMPALSVMISPMKMTNCCFKEETKVTPSTQHCKCIHVHIHCITKGLHFFLKSYFAHVRNLTLRK